MNRFIYFTLFALTTISCNSSQNSTDENNSEAADNKYANGEKVYQANCVACHQSEGEGVEGVFPPLANSDYLMADKNRAIKQIINGSSGEMVVNGITYNTVMPPQPLNDDEVKDVMNYILNAWGNKGGVVTLEEVKAQR
ncbi:MAG: cytochrome c [Crocinitomicaceae bacterium]|nr:cytochrome c [Crocinitomicaceae bacterium]